MCGKKLQEWDCGGKQQRQEHQLCPASAVLAANRDPPKCRLHRLKAWKISCHVAVGAGKPAIAQLVEHLTVELCSYQMVPGSIPGGRICTDLSFGCSAGSNILIFHSQVVRTSGKQMFQKSLAPVRVSHGAFHGFGSVPFDPFVRVFLIFYVSFLRHVQNRCDWWS